MNLLLWQTDETISVLYHDDTLLMKASKFHSSLDTEESFYPQIQLLQQQAQALTAV